VSHELPTIFVTKLCILFSTSMSPVTLQQLSHLNYLSRRKATWQGSIKPIIPCKLELFVKKKSNLTRFYKTHSMQTTHVGGWAVLYFYGEPWVPVLKNINWNGSSSSSTHKWNRESRFQVPNFPQKIEKKMMISVLVPVLKSRPTSSLVLDNLG